MHLLYLDDSGTIGDPQTAHCLLAGFSIFETKTFWVEQEIEKIVEKHSLPSVMEFHASHIMAGKKAWRKLPKNVRQEVLLDLCQVIKNRQDEIRLFVSVHNIARSQSQGTDLNTELFTQVASRFDMFLGRIYRNVRKRERGIIIFDKSKSENIIQKMSHRFRNIGHKWGTLRNLAEVPLFLDSKASRLIQLADIVAYAFHRKYNLHDLTYSSMIEDCLDAEGHTIHGLHEYL
jgi:hypothetical protein